MKPILLIILVVATCNSRKVKITKVAEPYKIELSVSTDSVYNVSGTLHGITYYDKISMFPTDTTVMIDEAKEYIFAIIDKERKNESEVLVDYSVFDLFRD